MSTHAATDFLLYPPMSTESSVDMFSSSQPMFFSSDSLSGAENLSAMDSYTYGFLESGYQPLSQNIPPHPTRAMKPFFNPTSPLYLDPTATDLSRQIRYTTGPATPPVGPAPHMMDRVPTPFSASNPSITSASTSANASPYTESCIDTNTGLELQSRMLSDLYPADFTSIKAEMDSSEFAPLPTNYVDPVLINQEAPLPPPTSSSYSQESIFPEGSMFAPNQPHASSLPITQTSLASSIAAPHQFVTHSPYLTNLPSPHGYDRSSLPPSGMHSPRSQNSPSMSQADVDEDGRERGRCLFPDCGRQVKDLKAHMLTHQSERPEKCPIVTCEYHQKGFARKYDKNRHTLIHYKGTMVCGFCPGSGSAAEKSFNRADVFKRHLTSVHGVELTPPNCRKRSPTSSSGTALSGYSPDATGKCSTCSKTFRNAQEFYEHLDDCVLRVVQQEQPSEAINQQRLAEVAADEDVKKTMQRHMLLDSPDNTAGTTSPPEENGDDALSHGSSSPPLPHPANARFGSNNNKRKGKGTSGTPSVLKPIPSNNGITKPRVPVTRRRGNQNNYPQSWGCPTDKVNTKRRVVCLYDGQDQLWKDEMMLDRVCELRIRLPGSAGDGTCRDAYVTDLDIATMNRAVGVFSATEEERGPCLSGPPNRLIGQPAMLLPELPQGQFGDEVDIDELIPNV